MTNINIHKSAIGVIYCPSTAKQAHDKGLGKIINVVLGGRINNDPWLGKMKIFALGNGLISSTGRMFKGNIFSLGFMAGLSFSGIKVVVSSKRMQAAEKSIFRHVNIEPKDLDLLVLKSTVHFRADFNEFKHVLIVKSRSSNFIDHSKYKYKNLRKGVRLMPMSITTT